MARNFFGQYTYTKKTGKYIKLITIKVYLNACFIYSNIRFP